MWHFKLFDYNYLLQNNWIFPILPHFWSFLPCTIQWEKCKVQVGVFFTSELNSLHNFGLESISNFNFHTFGSKTGVGSCTLS